MLDAINSDNFFETISGLFTAPSKQEEILDKLGWWSLRSVIDVDASSREKVTRVIRKYVKAIDTFLESHDNNKFKEDLQRIVRTT